MNYIEHIAKCQILHPTRMKKCDKCRGRFLCFSRRFSPADLNIPSWSFYVPNNDEGKLFMSLLSKYLNKDVWRLKKRGRAKNRAEKGGCQNNQPLEKADSIAVYLHTTDLIKAVHTYDKT